MSKTHAWGSVKSYYFVYIIAQASAWKKQEVSHLLLLSTMTKKNANSEARQVLNKKNSVIQVSNIEYLYLRRLVGNKFFWQVALNIK